MGHAPIIPPFPMPSCVKKSRFDVRKGARRLQQLSARYHSLGKPRESLFTAAFHIMMVHFSRCGDRLLAVDGHSLENLPHSVAVSMLKQTSTRVVLEVVSWVGTEL